MTWTVLKSGDYKGKTLPQILFTNPDWFFFCMDTHRFNGSYNLAFEAEYIELRARSIRIPKEGDLEVEYIQSKQGAFMDVSIVPSNDDRKGDHSIWRNKVIDMGIHHREKGCKDIEGIKLFVEGLKKILFGRSDARMTRKKCEMFFEDATHFHFL